MLKSNKTVQSKKMALPPSQENGGKNNPPKNPSVMSKFRAKTPGGAGYFNGRGRKGSVTAGKTTDSAII